MAKNNKNSMLVVIAEDSLTQAESLRYMLEGLGYTVIHALNGKDALVVIRDNMPGLVISDVIMPEMDGYLLCETLKSDIITRDIPFILLTSLTDPSDVIRGLECGADSYMMKPLDENFIKLRINQVLDNMHLLSSETKKEEIDISFAGKKYQINSSPLQIVNLLMSTYDTVVQSYTEIARRETETIRLNNSLKQQVEDRKRQLRQQLQQKIEAEQLLQESREKYKELVQNALIGIFISNSAGELILANDAIREMLGYDSIDELLKIRIIELYKEKAARDALLKQLKIDGFVSGHEVELLTKTGETRYVTLSASLENDQISGVLIDITERKLADIRFKEYQDDLIRSKEKAERSEKLKTAFLANMSNEILTPMNSLIGFSEIISDQELSSDKLLEYTTHINSSGNSLINLIDNIIDIAKIEAGELRIRKSGCKVNHVMLDLYTQFESELIDKKKQEIRLYLKRAIRDDEFTIQSETYRLRQIISNLLSNAVKYTDSGKIEFGYTIEKGDSDGHGEHLQFFVRDSGKGMSPEQIKNLFNRFKQSANVYLKRTEGVGMGLPISKSYVELLGGTMSCISEPGKGTEFIFTHPYERLESKADEAVITNPPVSASNSRFTILVAEDVESNFVYLKTLMRDLDFDLLWAKNGKEAIEIFRNNSEISLVLMDVRMPEMSGFEAIPHIRKINKDIPIIIQTAFAREDNRDEIELSGCNDYITKPIRKEMLIEAISKYLVLKS